MLVDLGIGTDWQDDDIAELIVPFGVVTSDVFQDALEGLRGDVAPQHDVTGNDVGASLERPLWHTGEVFDRELRRCQFQVVRQIVDVPEWHLAGPMLGVDPEHGRGMSAYVRHTHSNLS